MYLLRSFTIYYEDMYLSGSKDIMEVLTYGGYN